jgi:hypothetical protein
MLRHYCLLLATRIHCFHTLFVYLFFIFHYALSECKAFLASEFAFQAFNLMVLHSLLYFSVSSMQLECNCMFSIIFQAFNMVVLCSYSASFASYYCLFHPQVSETKQLLAFL